MVVEDEFVALIVVLVVAQVVEGVEVVEDTLVVDFHSRAFRLLLIFMNSVNTAGRSAFEFVDTEFHSS